MKKNILLVLFLTVSLGMYAQKNYVTLWGKEDDWNCFAYLSGDVPASMKLRYSGDDFPELQLTVRSSVFKWIGAVLNLLAKEGYTVEQMNSTSTIINYLLSKPSDESNANNVRMVRDMKNDSEVYEVARYNLQGMPVNESEKGFQIIVYSNFTTKTIIKE